MSAPRKYEVVLTPEAKGGFSVTAPLLPGCMSQGETHEEALSMIREAIEVYIESLVAHGSPLPGAPRSSEFPSLRGPRPPAVTPHQGVH
jgi:antitoxin HicB